MIDKNEIRIGDYIMTDMDKVIWVSEIIHLKEVKEWVFVGWHEETKERLSVNFFDAKPIELTPDILIEWCGFTEWGDTLQYEGFVDYWKCSFNADHNEWDIYYAYDKGRTGQKIASKKYLHQFQNLFFSLTETELEINLIKQKNDRLQ